MSTMPLPDLDLLVDDISSVTGRTLSLERRFEVGSGAGAYSVRDGIGTPLVLKWWPDQPAERERFAQRHARIPVLRDLGWPIPDLLHHGTAGRSLYEIWEVASGEPGVSSPASPNVVARSSELVASARGAALGHGDDWPTWLTTWITTRLNGIGAAPGSQVEHQVARCRKALASTSIPPGRDLIHGDFTPANLLIQGDEVTAVIDFDDCRDGDGTLDLIGIVWDLEGWEKASPGMVDSLWADFRSQVEADYGRVLLAYWISGTLAWATGTDDEARMCSLANRAWQRFF